MLGSGKASAFGSLKPAGQIIRQFASKPNNGPPRPGWGPDDPEFQRELFMDVLGANATKRDAKQYLAQFKPAKPSVGQHVAGATDRQAKLERIGVNLGGLYSPARAIAEAPQFAEKDAKPADEDQKAMHVALVCLRAPQKLDDATLEGLAITFTQLIKLGIRIALVLELDEFASTFEHENVRVRRAAFTEQALRISNALRRYNPEGARFVIGALETDEAATDFGEGSVRITLPKLLEDPLKRGIIPIVPCLAYNPHAQLVEARVTDVMASMTEHFSHSAMAKEDDETGERTALDRIIVLDPAGGIPSKVRGDHAHVFVNLEQEFDDIIDELSEYDSECKRAERHRVFQQHQENLRMLKRCLGMLPSSSSALIIAPREAASSEWRSATDDATIGTGTRRSKNTLIYNLLTNKPLVSSSLPPARMPALSQSGSGSGNDQESKTATLVRLGMPLTIIPPADRRFGWQRPASGRTSLYLRDDPRVDLPKLVHLINDSFKRKLDVEHYLKRIEGRVAGLIVAGAYEGGAILTWEQPPDTTDPARLVPYLDKFAVLQSSQGSAGVADILFQAMVRSCFPDGVCWRSRKDNPANKWYLERATGSWKMPDSNWTMFWTGEGVVENTEKWNDYVAVCSSVVPSWADNKKPD
jgi:amino-acid N-acetyltransferase